MNKKILFAIGIAGCAAAYAAKKDPAVMTINGVDVPKSEFEYLYNKNSRQQLGSQTLDEYAEMFKVYKMKVQDALAEGIDTTASFRNELQGYRNELAAPYMVDSVALNDMVKEAYDRMSEDVEVSHIMLFKGPDASMNFDVRQRMDSINGLLKNGADFATLAKEYSEDTRSAAKGGNMGYIAAMMYPYDFETAAYTLKPGEVSDVVESPMGYHIIKRGNARKARGSVLVKHILRLVPQDATSEQQAAIKAQIDSIYNVAISGGDFEALATKYSDDPGSAAKGGALPWFGIGRMVPEFEETAFTIAKDEISAPVRTSYGWHIIKKYDERGVDSFENLRPNLIQYMSHTKDGRREHLYNAKVAKLAAKYGLKVNNSIVNKMRQYISANGCDAEFFNRFLESPKSKTTLLSFAGQTRTVGDFLSTLSQYRSTEPARALDFFDMRLRRYKDSSIYSFAQENIDNEYPDFRNLINEYRDGMLLFEVSNKKVWDKAAQDTEGLNNYFNNHKSDYKWSTPHVKGLMVQTTGDSVANIVKARMAELPADSLITTVRKEFADNVKIDKVLRAKGENPMIDALAFGEGTFKPANSRYPVCFLYDFKVIDAPEEAADVRGQVTSDYQNELEQQWIDELKAKYPVTVNEKELKKIK